jgi:chromosome segregation ATPase
MLSLAEDNRKKLYKIIRMTYNEEVLRKACSDTEKNLESTVNYLKPTCTEKDLQISTMQCEINSKQEGIRRLNHQIQAQTNDLKEYKENKNKLHKRVRELQYQVEKYEKTK